MVILGTRTLIGEEAFADWGWRIPFLLSIFLLGISVWIRLSMNESPAFKKMKEEGKTSKAPLTESFGQWKNLKFVILALVGLTAGQAVVWYTGQFYALFFLTQSLKVDGPTANILIAFSLLIGTPFFIIFGTLSDKIGRKPIIMAGCLIAALTFFPLFKALTEQANPELAAAQAKNKVTVTADPSECSFQFNPTGTVKFTSSCDIAKQVLAGSSVSYDNVVGTGAAKIAIGDKVIEGYTSMSLPYHIGNGWFGGLLPTTAFAIVAQTGNMYNGLWYPVIIASATFAIGMLFVRETKDVDIYAND